MLSQNSVQVMSIAITEFGVKEFITNNTLFSDNSLQTIVYVIRKFTAGFMVVVNNFFPRLDPESSCFHPDFYVSKRSYIPCL